MPFINSKISVALTDAQEQEIKSRLGQAITAIPGKSESWLMVGFEPEYKLYFRGSKDQPMAMVEVSVYGSENPSAFSKLTGEICKIFEDFARNMHLEKNAEQAITHLLEQPEEIALDYGEVTTNHPGSDAKRFLISSGVGYDANICEEVSRSRLKAVLNKIHLGKLVYVLIGVKQIFAKKTVRAKLYLDDAPVMKLPELFFVVGMNHMYEGGGIPFCPNANPTDGKLDVCLVKGMSRLKLLFAVVLVYFKKHLLFKDITNHRCKKMRLVTETPQWIHMDGETPYQVSEVTWESKGKLRFVR